MYQSMTYMYSTCSKTGTVYLIFGQSLQIIDYIPELSGTLLID